MADIKTETITTYVHEDDKTVVWQNLLVNDEVVQQSIIGWYFGHPDEKAAMSFANMPLTAQFIGDVYQTRQSYNAYEDDYSEALALQDLLVAINRAVDKQCDNVDKDRNDYGHFTICISGKSIDFVVGGPQIEGLQQFIKSIAGENFYEVDYQAERVISHLFK